METKKEWKPTRLTGVRKIDRAVARRNMEKAGKKRFCKHDHTTMYTRWGGKGETTVVPSEFAMKWRDYVYLR